MRAPLVAILLAFLFFFMGCIGQQSPPPSPPSLEIRADISGSDACASSGVPCMCMVCKNESAGSTIQRILDFLSPDSVFTPPSSLRNGYCFIDKECKEEDITRHYLDVANSKDYYLKTFMMGQGSSFTAFDEANTYCNNQMTLAVKWMIGRDNEVPPPLYSGRAACYLDHNIIPFYIYYVVDSSGDSRQLRAEDVDAIRLMAQNLSRDPERSTWFGLGGQKPLGFAMIAPKAEFDVSDVPMVKEQIRAIKDACKDLSCPGTSGCPAHVDDIGPVTIPRCAVVVIPKNQEALEALMGDPTIANKVDIIGLYAVPKPTLLSDGTIRYFFFRSGHDFVAWATNYSKYILNRFQKPSLIAYVAIPYSSDRVFETAYYEESDELVDPNDPSKGYQRILRKMTWTGETASQFADDVTALVPAFVESGILGIAYFQWFDGVYYSREGASPTAIEGNLGLMVRETHDANGNPLPTPLLVQKNPLFHAWFQGCRDYYGENLYTQLYKQKYFPPSSPSSPSTGSSTLPSREEITFFSQSPLIFSGDGKVNQFCNLYSSFETFKRMYKREEARIRNDSSLLPDYSQELSPFIRHYACDYCLGVPPAHMLRSVSNYYDESSTQCIKWDYEVRAAAEQCNIDPLFVRAMMIVESSMDHCVRVCVTPTGHKDISRTCDTSYATVPSSYSFCSFGLMQLKFNYGQQVLGAHTPDTKWCASKNTWNPFDPSHNICAGVYHLCRNIDDVKSVAYSTSLTCSGFSFNPREALSLRGNDEDDRFMIMFLAATAYNKGNVRNALCEWYEKTCFEDTDGDGVQENICAGGNPPISFPLYICVYEQGPEAGYACKVMTEYKKLYGIDENTGCYHNCEFKRGLKSSGIASQCAAQAINFAKDQLGCEYGWGGCTPKVGPTINEAGCTSPSPSNCKFDCSHFVFWSLAAACGPESLDYYVSRYMCDRYVGEGKAEWVWRSDWGSPPPSVDQLKLGDILILHCTDPTQEHKSHALLYAGGGEIIHSGGSTGVSYTTYSNFLSSGCTGGEVRKICRLTINR